MTHWSIRTRLTVWYSIILLAGLLLIGGGIWLVVSHSLMASLDDALLDEAKGVHTVIDAHYNPARPGLLDEELSEYIDATPEGNLTEVLDPQGHALIASKMLHIIQRGVLRTDGFGMQQASGDNYRILVASYMVRGQPFHVLVAAPLDSTQNTLRRLRETFLWMAPAVLLIAALSGYWISGRALAPVDEITRAAQSIGIQNLSGRLAVPSTGDELQRLSETWNEMLARLETAVKRLSQFTADASHELRTPIALIRTTAELTLRRERTPQTYREALRQIVAESERTARLIRIKPAKCSANTR